MEQLDSPNPVLVHFHKLRFPPTQALTYQIALAKAGFDDVQSICEDCELHDFHAAGLLPGHARRLLKAARFAHQHNNNNHQFASSGILSQQSYPSSNASSSIISVACPDCNHQFSMNLMSRSTSRSRSNSGSGSAKSKSPIPSPGNTSANAETHYGHNNTNNHSNRSINTAYSLDEYTHKSTFTNSPSSVETDAEIKLYMKKVNMQQSVISSAVDSDADSSDMESFEFNANPTQIQTLVKPSSFDMNNFDSNEAGKQPPNTHPKFWTVGSVVSWLRQTESLRNRKVISKAVANQLTGSDLLGEDPAMIMDSLNIVFGPHKRIFLRELETLRLKSKLLSMRTPSPATQSAAAASKKNRDFTSAMDELSIASELNDDDSAVKGGKGKKSRAQVFSMGAAKNLQPGFAPPKLLNLGNNVSSSPESLDEVQSNSSDSTNHSPTSEDNNASPIYSKKAKPPKVDALRIEMDSIYFDSSSNYTNSKSLTPQSHNGNNPNPNPSTSTHKIRHDSSWEMSQGGTLNVDGYTVKTSGISALPDHPHLNLNTIPELDRTASRTSSRGTGTDTPTTKNTHHGVSASSSVSHPQPTPSKEPTPKTALRRRDNVPNSALRANKNTKEELIILKEVGRGACGVVFEALHVPTMKLVAVKSVAVIETAKRKQMLRELKTMHSMCFADLDDMEYNSPGIVHNNNKTSDDTRRRTHPYIVSFYDAYTDPEKGAVRMVLEYMNAGTLQDLVSACIPITERMLASVASSVLKGLNEVHESMQIHRDIKPSNILLDREGNIKISDFGIARKLEHSISMASTFTGTLTYMSPERIAGESYDSKCDIWSLGVCLATLALGKYPYPTNEGYWGVVQAIQDNAVPQLPKNQFGEEMQEFLDICLDKDPRKRWSAEALLNHKFLKRFENNELAVPCPPEASPKRVKAMSELARRVMDYYAERYEKRCLEDKENGIVRENEGEVGPEEIVPLMDGKLLRVLAAQLGMPVEVLVEVFGREADKVLIHLNVTVKVTTPTPKLAPTAQMRLMAVKPLKPVKPPSGGRAARSASHSKSPPQRIAGGTAKGPLGRYIAIALGDGGATG